MLVVNNVDQLKKVTVFNPQKSYYKFVTLIRAKDYKDSNEKPILSNTEKQEVFVRQWLVDSKESLEKCLPDMLAVTELFKCRLYMTIDRKSTLKTMMQIRNKMQECIDHFAFNENSTVSVRMLNKVVPSASSVVESSDRDYKRWMFDVDCKSKELLKLIEKKVCGEHYLATFETKNGYHVLANKKFDANRVLKEAFSINKVLFEHEDYNVYIKEYNETYKEFVELKDNALVLVAMGG